MSNQITKIKAVNIEKFRGLNNVSINFGERITIICGKNGTSKSTILGIVAQMFNFETDYTKLDPVTNQPIDLRGFKNLAGKPFISQFKEHFRLSKKFDLTGTMKTGVHIYDGAEKKELKNLELGLYLRTNPNTQNPSIRATVRNNTTTNGASDSRKITHPVAFLSLKRLTPITDRIKYEVTDIQEFMEENKGSFMHDSLHILGRRGGESQLTQTTGTIDSMVVSGENYDHESVSVGEDNIGQILQAVYSFKKLKQEYADYHGGIILIDEVDAGLFPAAQRRLIERLVKFSKHLDLQIIMTTHSPTIIDTINSYSTNNEKEYKVCYLTNTHGDVTVKNNYSWNDISRELNNERSDLKEKILSMNVNVFFEDKQNYDFYTSLITKRSIKKHITPLKDINLGCGNYKLLLDKKIPGIYDESIIVFDGDVTNIKKYNNVIKLPTNLPPDQLLFEFLYNLPREDSFWDNDYGYHKDFFIEKADEVLYLINTNDHTIELSKLIKNFRQIPGKKPRDVFKDFAKEEVLQKLVNKGGVKYNPYRLWVDKNKLQAELFEEEFIDCLSRVLSIKYNVEQAEIKKVILKN